MRTSALAATVARGRHGVTQLFFRYFFRLLLGAVALAEWICLAHLARVIAHPVPLWSHVAGPALLYLLNRLLVRLPPQAFHDWRHGTLQAYSAFAFTTLFGAAFLILSAAVWTGLAFMTQGVSLAAGNQAALVAPLPSVAYDWVSTAGLTIIGLTFLYGYTFGQRRLSFTTLRLPLGRGRPGLAGMRIVHISDVHLGRYMSPETLQSYVDRVNRLDADLVVLTGDILDTLGAIPHGFPVLAQLRARAGVFAVLGNHDCYAGADEVAAALQRMTPLRVLRNEIATVEIDGALLQIAGVDDLGRDWARGVHWHPGLAQLLPRFAPEAPVLLLTHRPDLFPQAAAAGIDLVLSGHTHGGQLSLPSFGGRPLSLARAITPYDRGLYRRNGSALYVNRGLGCTAQRIRLCSPREVTIIELDVPGHPGAPRP